MKLIFVAALMLTAFSVHAEQGSWSTSTTFAQMNTYCTRTYTCGPSQDIIHSEDTKVLATSPKLVWGVCSAGDGPIDGCNVCNTNPLDDKCEWSLQKK